MSLIGLSGVTAMAGIPAGLPAGVRVSDHISLGVIAQAFPPDRVQQVLAETGKASERERDLPAQVMVYYAIAMALYMGSSTREVLRCLLGGLRWLWGADAVKVAGKADGQATALSKLPAHPFGNLPQPHQGSSARHPPAGDLEQVSAFIRRQGRMFRQFEGLRAPVRRERVVIVVVAANGDGRGPGQPLALEQAGHPQRGGCAPFRIRGAQPCQVSKQAPAVGLA